MALALFSPRNPVTGENQLFGEFLLNAQGDVVAGIRTPEPIRRLRLTMPKFIKILRRTFRISLS